jgi:hypothetical protein
MYLIKSVTVSGLEYGFSLFSHSSLLLWHHLLLLFFTVFKQTELPSWCRTDSSRLWISSHLFFLLILLRSIWWCRDTWGLLTIYIFIFLQIIMMSPLVRAAVNLGPVKALSFFCVSSCTERFCVRSWAFHSKPFSLNTFWYLDSTILKLLMCILVSYVCVFFFSVELNSLSLQGIDNPVLWFIE